MKYTLTEQIKCIEREIERRERNYPYLIIQNKMTKGQAEKEIELMKSIYNTLILAERCHIDKSWNTPTDAE